MATLAWLQYRAESDRLSLLEREAQVTSSQERLEAYSDDLEAVSDDLNKRMQFLEQMTETLPPDVKSQDPASNAASPTTKTIQKVSSSFPEAAELARIEARQMAYVERLTNFADDRSQRAQSAIRKLGLDPNVMLRNASREAMGGPFELLATSNDGKIDPRFERLGLSLARMTALERGLDSIPQFTPTSRASTRVSSGYGYRRDPFNGRPAMHRGMDFKGPHGAPIYSAANGVVSFAGWHAGYGKTIEVRHGNGLSTRYAHMSRFAVRKGQRVAAGDVIGAIGSTGRSTGPHLHFEVRINNRAVNPRPFLERAPDVLKEARRKPASHRTQARKDIR